MPLPDALPGSCATVAGRGDADSTGGKVARSRRPGVRGLLGLSVAAAAAAMIIGRFVYPLGSINNDERMYVFSARLLGRGHLTLPSSFAPFGHGPLAPETVA